jgi:hypothetical protein
MYGIYGYNSFKTAMRKDDSFKVPNASTLITSSTSCSFQRKKSRTTNNTNACKPIGLSFECEAKEATRQEADCFKGEVDNLSNFKMMEGPKVKSSLIQRHFLNAKWKKF